MLLVTWVGNRDINAYLLTYSVLEFQCTSICTIDLVLYSRYFSGGKICGFHGWETNHKIFTHERLMCVQLSWHRACSVNSKFLPQKAKFLSSTKVLPPPSPPPPKNTLYTVCNVRLIAIISHFFLRASCWSSHDRSYGCPEDWVHGVNWGRQDHNEERCREQCQKGVAGAWREIPINHLWRLWLGQGSQIGESDSALDYKI